MFYFICYVWSFKTWERKYFEIFKEWWILEFSGLQTPLLPKFSTIQRSCPWCRNTDVQWARSKGHVWIPRRLIKTAVDGRHIERQHDAMPYAQSTRKISIQVLLTQKWWFFSIIYHIMDLSLIMSRLCRVIFKSTRDSKQDKRQNTTVVVLSEKTLKILRYDILSLG